MFGYSRLTSKREINIHVLVAQRVFINLTLPCNHIYFRYYIDVTVWQLYLNIKLSYILKSKQIMTTTYFMIISKVLGQRKKILVSPKSITYKCWEYLMSILDCSKSNLIFDWRKSKNDCVAQSAGFEPARENPIGFQVQRLNHSATAAIVWIKKQKLFVKYSLNFRRVHSKIILGMNGICNVSTLAQSCHLKIW